MQWFDCQSPQQLPIFAELLGSSDLPVQYRGRDEPEGRAALRKNAAQFSWARPKSIFKQISIWALGSPPSHAACVWPAQAPSWSLQQKLSLSKNKRHQLNRSDFAAERYQASVSQSKVIREYIP